MVGGQVEGGVGFVGEVGIAEEGGMGACQASDEGEAVLKDSSAEACRRVDPG